MSEHPPSQREDRLADPKSASELLPLVYTELRRLAAAKMARESPGQTLQATALVHEAYLRLARSGPARPWGDRIHFFAAAAEAMRRILIENARRKARLKRGGGLERVDVEPMEIAAATPDEKLLLIDEVVDQLEIDNPIEARVVKLHYFAGLTLSEISAALQLSEATVRRRLAFAKVWLLERIEQGQKKG